MEVPRWPLLLRRWTLLAQQRLRAIKARLCPVIWRVHTPTLTRSMQQIPSSQLSSLQLLTLLCVSAALHLLTTLYQVMVHLWCLSQLYHLLKTRPQVLQRSKLQLPMVCLPPTICTSERRTQQLTTCSLLKSRLLSLADPPQQLWLSDHIPALTQPLKQLMWVLQMLYSTLQQFLIRFLDALSTCQGLQWQDLILALD